MSFAAVAVGRSWHRRGGKILNRNVHPMIPFCGSSHDQRVVQRRFLYRTGMLRWTTEKDDSDDFQWLALLPPPPSLRHREESPHQEVHEGPEEELDDADGMAGVEPEIPQGDRADGARIHHQGRADAPGQGPKAGRPAMGGPSQWSKAGARLPRSRHHACSSAR